MVIGGVLGPIRDGDGQMTPRLLEMLLLRMEIGEAAVGFLSDGRRQLTEGSEPLE